ncbi:MAG: hypothetical protein JRI57_09035, partial [Deltaproteobacteria bacterium]|nr:hypothetical protein [Deltaproteobacteria bacterium]
MTVEPKPQIYYSQDEIAKLLSSESPIRAERRTYQPCLCARLQAGAGGARPLPGFELEVLRSAQEQLPLVSQNKLIEIVPGQHQFRLQQPCRLGIVLSGGPAPGGHNVIAGVFEAAKQAHPDNRLIGFLAGPK